MAAPVSSEERLFSLLLALSAARNGLSRAEIFEFVHGYSERFVHGESQANMERQFERDKEALRALGIQIETIDSPDEPGNNQKARYRVQPETLSLPPETRFTGLELSLLRLATYAWRDSLNEPDARRAAMKLNSLGDNFDSSMLGVNPRITTHDQAFTPLSAAITDHNTAEFDYQKPSDAEPARRRVAPLALEKLDGRWNLIAYDFDRAAPRVFLLSRITSSVKISTMEYDAELLELTAQTLQDLNDLRARNIAEVLVAVGSEAMARFEPESDMSPTFIEGAEAGMKLMRIHFLDALVLAEDLMTYGADVQVLTPPEVRERVVALFQDIYANHSTGVAHG